MFRFWSALKISFLGFIFQFGADQKTSVIKLKTQLACAVLFGEITPIINFHLFLAKSGVQVGENLHLVLTNVCVRSAFAICVCACRPADCGTSAECLPFPQSFDVTRSCCDNEPRAPPQGEHPAVCPGPQQQSQPPPQLHAHTCKQNRGEAESHLVHGLLWIGRNSSLKSALVSMWTVHTTDIVRNPFFMGRFR